MQDIKIKELSQITNKYENVYVCKHCKKQLTSKRNLELHEFNMCNTKDKCSCQKCKKQFISMKYLKRHTKTCQSDLTCTKCGKQLKRKYTYLQHISKCKNIIK